MELRRALVLLRRRIVLVVVLVLVGLLGTYLGTSTTARYPASATLFVGKDQGNVDVSTEVAQGVLALTLRTLLPTNAIAAAAIKATGVHRSPAEVAAETTAVIAPGTALIKLTIEDRDPVVARDLVNAAAQAFVTATRQLTPLVDGTGATATSRAPVTIAQSASVPTSPISTDTRGKVLLGGLAGLIVGVALALLLDAFGLASRSPRQLEELMDLPVIGVVPLQSTVEGATPAEPGAPPGDLPLLRRPDA